MKFFKTVYYWFVRYYYFKQDGRHLSKEENYLQGKWIVKYEDGECSKPCFWDVAYLKTVEEPNSEIMYIGPGHEYLVNL